MRFQMDFLKRANFEMAARGREEIVVLAASVTFQRQTGMVHFPLTKETFPPFSSLMPARKAQSRVFYKLLLQKGQWESQHCWVVFQDADLNIQEQKL